MKWYRYNFQHTTIEEEEEEEYGYRFICIDRNEGIKRYGVAA